MQSRIVVLHLDHWLRFLRALVEMLQRWLAAQTSRVIEERGRGIFSTALLPTR
jgi:hypothetical protein